MPNRIIKESICTSTEVDQLNWFEEVLFYRLIVNCDDYGRFDGRPAVIKSRLFPLKENITLKNVSMAIDKLARIGLITPYESGGKPFLLLPTWNDHQVVRAKKSKFPDPENFCMHPHATEIRCSRNPIQSESKSESNPNPKAQSARAAAFDAFWSAYPRKEGKQKAVTAFEKVDVPVAVLLEAIEKQKRSAQWSKDGGQFIPHAATWLNGKRWEDQLVEGKQEIPKGASGVLGEAELEAIQRVLREG